MNWIPITLIAVLLWSISNIIDKAVLNRHFKKPMAYVFFTGIFSALPLVIIPYTGLAIPSLLQIGLAIITGMLYVYAVIPYIYALFNEEVSRVIPVWQITPVFVLMLSYFFLGEVLTGTHLIAVALLVIGSILVSARKIKGLIKLNKAFYLMVLSSALFSIMYVLSKYVYLNQSYIHGFLWIRIGSVIALISLFLIGNYRDQFISTVKGLKAKVHLTIAASQLSVIAGVTLANYAISLGPVTLVTAVEGTQPLFVFILATIISVVYPRLLKEEVSRKTMLIKFAAITLITLGVYLVSI